MKTATNGRSGLAVGAVRVTPVSVSGRLRGGFGHAPFNAGGSQAWPSPIRPLLKLGAQVRQCDHQPVALAHNFQLQSV
jgi:hypothetical protein